MIRSEEWGQILPMKGPRMAIDVKEKLAAVNETKLAALDAARPQAVAKQHALGKLTSRERLDLLVDPGTFFEYGIPPKKRGVIPW